MPDLPQPTDESERKVVADIEEYGWHCVLVRPGAHAHANEFVNDFEDKAAFLTYESAFSYTAGLWQTFRHPEIVLVGDWQHAHAYLNVVGGLVSDGHRFVAGSVTTALLEGYEVRFDSVGARARADVLTWASWANGRKQFDALQLVLPDTQGRWPEHEEYYGFDQPLLAA